MYSFYLFSPFYLFFILNINFTEEIYFHKLCQSIIYFDVNFDIIFILLTYSSYVKLQKFDWIIQDT